MNNRQKEYKIVRRNTLKLTYMYDNPYETAYHLIRSNSMFREEDWDTFARRGQLQEYIQLIDDSRQLSPDLAKIWSFDLLDSDTRFAILANELYGDRTELKKRKETFFNNKTGKEETREWEATEYDYVREALEQRRDFERSKLLRLQQQQRKDNLNGFVKGLGFLAAIPAEAAVSIIEISQDFISLIEGVVDGFDSMIKGEGFEEGFREAFNINEWGGSDWRFLDGISDAILEWEKNYTYMRTLDGSYTTLGKYIGGVASSLGKALPMIITNMVGGQVFGAGTKGASTLANTATALYYTGLGLGTFREMASNPEFASIPTSKLLLNASIRTVTEFLIQKGVSRAFGPTQLDKLMWGETVKVSSKIGTSSALRRIAKDFYAEGIEEFLQSYSNWFIDSFFAITNEEFAANSDWNLQVAIDSFILGGLSTIGGNLMSVSKSVVQDINTTNKVAKIESQIEDVQTRLKRQTDVDTVAKLQKELDSLTHTRNKLLAQPKLNFLASWELKNTVAALFTEYNRLVKNDKLSDTARQQAVGQMFATFRIIADVYADIGHDRFMKAQKMLEKLSEKSFDNVYRIPLPNTRRYTPDMDASTQLVDLDRYAPRYAVLTDKTSLLTESKRQYINAFKSKDVSIKKSNIIISQLLDMRLGQAERRLYERKIEQAKMTEVVTTVERSDDVNIAIKESDPEKKKKVTETTKNIFDSDKNLNKIVVTKDGINIVSFENILFVPIKYLLADDGTMIIKNKAEQKLVDKTIASPLIKTILPDIKRQFEEFTNRKDVDMSEVVYNLYFNESFFRLLLSGSNKHIFQLLSRLNDIQQRVVPKSLIDDVYKRKIAAIKKKWGVALAQYLILQQHANYNDITVLSKPQRDFIRKHRFGKDLTNKILAGKALDADEINLLKARINSMRVSAKNKADIRKGLGFNSNWQKIKTSDLSRRNALMRLDNAYKNQFLSPYDNITYLTDDSLVNRAFNVFMIENGVTLQTVIDVDKTPIEVQREVIAEFGVFDSDSLIAYRKQQIEERTNGGISFEIENGKIQPFRRRTMDQYGYAWYRNEREKIKSGKNLANRQSVSPTQGRGRLDSMLNKDIDPATRGFLTLTDVIREPVLLNKTIRAGIRDRYTVINPNTTFLYLRDRTLDQTGSMSIVVRADGTYTFVDCKPMIEMLIDPEVDLIDVGSEGVNIDKFIKKKFLPEGRLSDITVRIYGDTTYYDAIDNVITIARTSINDPNLMRFSLLHEFQHAIETENNLNGGLNQNWLALSGLEADERARLIKDIRSHRPELFIKEDGKRVKPGSQKSLILYLLLSMIALVRYKRWVWRVTRE